MDLITLALYILNTFDEKRIKWQKRMMYVMVDEFQDVSGNQYDLANILSGYHKNLFVVGDPDQTIYSWRGAKIEYILDFDKIYKDAKTVILSTNYRSTPNILNASNSLIHKNKMRIEKNLFAVKEHGLKPIYNHSKTAKLEAEWIANQIKILVEKNKKYSDIAILYRAHFVSRSIEEVFVKEKIPYTLYSGIEFYKRKEIKDIISYLRMIIYEDDLSFQRVVNEPRRNFGKKRMTFLREYAERNNCSLYNALKECIDVELIRNTNVYNFVEVVEKYKSIYKEMALSDVLAAMLADSGYESMLRQAGEQDRLDNLAELKQSVFEFEKASGESSSLEEYLQDISLYSNLDKEYDKNSVKMMTVHTAKGLEFPCVFICALNEGIFPTSHALTVEKMEEERRLAYVAYTRAEDSLFLSDSEEQNYDGSFRYPSRFIFNTDKSHIHYTVELDPQLVDEALEYIKNSIDTSLKDITKFCVGNRVNHKVFGIGTIIEIKHNTSTLVIKFENSETERNLSLNAPLEKIDEVKC